MGSTGYSSILIKESGNVTNVLLSFSGIAQWGEPKSGYSVDVSCRTRGLFEDSYQSHLLGGPLNSEELSEGSDLILTFLDAENYELQRDAAKMIVKMNDSGNPLFYTKIEAILIANYKKPSENPDRIDSLSCHFR